MSDEYDDEFKKKSTFVGTAEYIIIFYQITY